MSAAAANTALVNAIAVNCPTCKALAGQACVTAASGRPAAKLHKARVEAAGPLLVSDSIRADDRKAARQAARRARRAAKKAAIELDELQPLLYRGGPFRITQVLVNRKTGAIVGHKATGQPLFFNSRKKAFAAIEELKAQAAKK